MNRSPISVGPDRSEPPAPGAPWHAPQLVSNCGLPRCACSPVKTPSQILWSGACAPARTPPARTVVAARPHARTTRDLPRIFACIGPAPPGLLLRRRRRLLLGLWKILANQIGARLTYLAGTLGPGGAASTPAGAQREIERRQASLVLYVRAAAMFEDEPHNIRTSIHGAVQRRIAVRVEGVDVAA